jgi:hypothetical protein
MTFLPALLLFVAAPQTDDATCPATRFTLNKPATPKVLPSKTEPEKTRVAQAASAAPKPKPTPKPDDCTTDKKKG